MYCVYSVYSCVCSVYCVYSAMHVLCVQCVLCVYSVCSYGYGLSTVWIGTSFFASILFLKGSLLPGI